ncbi:MAG: hypothetical protein WBD28_09005 [Candidatus Zixiibacteriota bacterium]
MQGKIKLLFPIFLVSLAVLALIFTFYKPAQTGPGGPPYQPLPKVYGDVDYSGAKCSYTNYDTVWILDSESTKIRYTLVERNGLSYTYEVEEFCEAAGYYSVFAFQDTAGCATEEYQFYYDGSEDTEQDIDFTIAPW